MKYQSAIESASKAHHVDPALIAAIIKHESNFNPKAYRYEPHIKDASYGLMQVLLRTARTITKNPSLRAMDLFIPEVNIDIGTRYLKEQLNRYKGNIDDAIAAYNAGSARKRIDGTYINQDYVTKVKRNYYYYKATYAIGFDPLLLSAGLVATGMTIPLLLQKRKF